jgi:tetratricopeptide (TPR) repeat protein
MNSSLDRAQLLYQQSRYELAEQEVRGALAQTPQDPWAHALLALCLVKQDKLDDAQAAAEQAIVLAPDWGYPHYCRSIILEYRQRFAEAEASAREALTLDPIDANYRAQLASVLYQQGKWNETLAAANEGLANDPEHAACSHLRTMALTKLGRQNDAVTSVDAVLARDPDDAMAHANKGWALLHQSKPREALEHFRESLRIDPTYRYAQQGIVEAVKARNPIYRWMLAYFLWMARLSQKAQWGVIIGGYFGVKVLSRIARERPDLWPWVFPLIAVYMVFALMTWYAYPFFNLMLRFNKFGWYALTPDQRTSSNWFGACLALFVGSIAVALATGEIIAYLLAAFAVGMALPLVTIYHCDAGWPRRAMSGFALVMALVGVAALVTAPISEPPPGMFGVLFLLGFMATPWLANYLVSVRATR